MPDTSMNNEQLTGRYFFIPSLVQFLHIINNPTPFENLTQETKSSSTGKFSSTSDKFLVNNSFPFLEVQLKYAGNSHCVLGPWVHRWAMGTMTIIGKALSFIMS